MPLPPSLVCFCPCRGGGWGPSAKARLSSAEGRPGDFSDSDKKLAERIGITFKTPDDFFGEMEGKKAVRAEKDSESKRWCSASRLLSRKLVPSRPCFQPPVWCRALLLIRRPRLHASPTAGYEANAALVSLLREGFDLTIKSGEDNA